MSRAQSLQRLYSCWMRKKNKGIFSFFPSGVGGLFLYLRPMPFSTVINQTETKQHLIDMVQNNRLSHALLFRGKEGAGALSLSLALAQYAVCEKVQNQNQSANMPSLFGFDEPPTTNDKQQTINLTDACGACPACVKSFKHVHPDIHFSFPVIPKKSGDKPVSTDYISEWREFINLYPYGNVFDWLQFINAENKQGNITAEECNEIIRKLSLKSFESRYKILIMWMPEYLGKEGNKLLKLIEEPPPDTLFILVTENEELMLSTIISSCQSITIPWPEKNDIEEALIQRAGAQPAQAQQIAAICEGNYREALQLMQHAEEDLQNIITDWLKYTLRQMLQDQTKWVEDIAKLGREKQKQLLRYFNHLIEQSIRFKIMGSGITLTDKEKDFAQRISKIAGINQLQALIQELDAAIYSIERNANAKMLFHALTIKMYHIIQNKTLILTA